MLIFNDTDKTLHSINDKTGVDQGSFCEGFIVENVASDFCTGEETATIKVYAKAGKNEVLVPLSEFTPQQLPKYLLSHGVTFLAIPDVSSSITAYALDSKADASITRTYERLGWYQKRKNAIFWARILWMHKKRIRCVSIITLTN